MALLTTVDASAPPRGLQQQQQLLVIYHCITHGVASKRSMRARCMEQRTTNTVTTLHETNFDALVSSDYLDPLMHNVYLDH